jgi:hypothetical protein
MSCRDRRPTPCRQCHSQPVGQLACIMLASVLIVSLFLDENIRYGQPRGRFKTRFQQICDEQAKKRLTPFGVFKNSKDWGLAEFLVESGLSQADIQKYLKLEMVSTRCYGAVSVASTDWYDF